MHDRLEELPNIDHFWFVFCYEDHTPRKLYFVKNGRVLVFQSGISSFDCSLSWYAWFLLFRTFRSNFDIFLGAISLRSFHSLQNWLYDLAKHVASSYSYSHSLLDRLNYWHYCCSLVLHYGWMAQLPNWCKTSWVIRQR